ncbi:MAG: response regulator [Bacteroidota bacterium]
MKTILIVDDEESTRKVIAASLIKKGYKTLEASDGLEGLGMAKAHRPDLIISDVYMENMNGFMMVEGLQEDPDTSLIPVIMMTSAAQGAGAWDSGAAVEYLEKGFSMSTMVETVERILKS